MAVLIPLGRGAIGPDHASAPQPMAPSVSQLLVAAYGPDASFFLAICSVDDDTTETLTMPVGSGDVLLLRTHYEPARILKPRYGGRPVQFFRQGRVTQRRVIDPGRLERAGAAPPAALQGDDKAIAHLLRTGLYMAPMFTAQEMDGAKADQLQAGSFRPGPDGCCTDAVAGAAS